MSSSKNKLIIDYLREKALKNDLKGILIDIFNDLNDNNSTIDSVINNQLSSKSISEDELNTMLTEFENQLNEDYKKYTNTKVEKTNKTNVSSKVKLVSNKDTNKDDVEVASINSTSNINSEMIFLPVNQVVSITPEIRAKPTAVKVNAVIDTTETKKNISNATTIANPLEQEKEIASKYPIQKVNIKWYNAKCWADAVIRMLYSAPSSRKFFIEYKGDNDTIRKISEIFKMMHNKNNTDRYTYSETTQPYITYNKLKNLDSDIETKIGYNPDDYSEETLGDNFVPVNQLRLEAEKDAPSYEFCRSSDSTIQYNENNIIKYTYFYDPAEFYSYIMGIKDSVSELSKYFSFNSYTNQKCKENDNIINENDNIIKYETHIKNIINLNNVGTESSSIQNKIDEFLDRKSTSFPLNYNKIVEIINNPNNGDKNEMLINDTNKINDSDNNKEIFNFYKSNGAKINYQNIYKDEIFYKYHEYFMKNHEYFMKNHSGESNDFFKDVYDLGNMNKNSNCHGITNHIEYEQNILEFTDQNKYIVILVQRRDPNNTNLIVQNIIIPDKQISISGIPYTLTGIISLKSLKEKDHYIYYECNHNGDVIRVYDDQKPYKDVNTNDKDVESLINRNGCMFLYSRYPVDQYNTENIVIEKKNSDGNQEGVKYFTHIQYKEDTINIEKLNKDYEKNVQQLIENISNIYTEKENLDKQNLNPSEKDKLQKEKNDLINELTESKNLLAKRLPIINKLISGETLYIGNFIKEKKGDGIKIENGKMYKCSWKDNNDNGTCSELENASIKVYDDGKTYYGQINNDKIDGYGIMVEKNNIIISNWENNKMISGTKSNGNYEHFLL